MDNAGAFVPPDARPGSKLKRRAERKHVLPTLFYGNGRTKFQKQPGTLFAITIDYGEQRFTPPGYVVRIFGLLNVRIICRAVAIILADGSPGFGPECDGSESRTKAFRQLTAGNRAHYEDREQDRSRARSGMVSR